jgi:predicted ABC-type sugar transport system permease subunit
MFPKFRTTLAALALAIVLPPVTAHAAGMRGIAFLVGEYTTGMTKQCIYESLGNQYVRTMRSIDLCPLSIQVP